MKWFMGLAVFSLALMSLIFSGEGASNYDSFYDDAQNSESEPALEESRPLILKLDVPPALSRNEEVETRLNQELEMDPIHESQSEQQALQGPDLGGLDVKLDDQGNPIVGLRLVEKSDVAKQADRLDQLYKPADVDQEPAAGD